MSDAYQADVDALVTEFNLPRDADDPIMAEVRRRGLAVEPSDRVDFPKGRSAAVRLRKDGQEVAYEVSAHVRLALILALRQVLVAERSNAR
jgi:hypothetical protein